ncbi:MAG: tetratricopeptide repeat protein [Bdellovibrionota bacterium]
MEEVSSSQPSQRTFVLNIQPKNTGTPSAAPEAAPQYSCEYLIENARLLLQNGDFLLAQNLYSRLLQSNIQDAEALKGLGICLLKLGDRPKAKSASGLCGSCTIAKRRSYGLASATPRKATIGVRSRPSGESVPCRRLTMTSGLRC